ncbi:MAG: L,D-transpeptidase [Eubacteriales bacterium]
MRKLAIFTILTALVLMLVVACSVLPDSWTATPTPEPTATPTPMPTPTSTPEPTPSPTPDPGPYGDAAYVIEEYDGVMSDEVPVNFKYRYQDRYIAYPDYVVFIDDGYIYSEMSVLTEPIKEVEYGERYIVSARLVAQPTTDVSWYRIHWTQSERVEGKDERVDVEHYGYVNSLVAGYREFQLETAYEETLMIAKAINDEDSLYVYVVNRSNSNGKAPDSGLTDEFGKTVDQFDVLRDQSAPAYSERSTDGEFRYIPDGTMVQILDIDREMAQVYIPEYDAEYYIPSEYLKYYFSDPESTITDLSECIVIDRKNQNIMYFELNEETGEWELLSMSYISTGTYSEIQDPTPLGIFMVQKRQAAFEYDFDNRAARAGYAPYALRFSGGAYLHGIPTNYVFDAAGNLISKPSPQEFLQSIGTEEKSHMCVRNYTSHAKFLYNRVNVGNAVVIVIE